MTINSALLLHTIEAGATSDDRSWRETRLPSESEFSKLLQNAPAENAAPAMAAPQAMANALDEATAKTDASFARALNGNEGAEDAKPVESKEDFTLSDLIDVINPLQHIPVIGSLYRNLTGDTLSGTARMIGGLAFGGPMGLLVATSSAIYAQEHGGRDIGEVAIASLTEDEAEKSEQQAKNQVADNSAEDVASDTESDAESPHKTADASADSAVNLAEVPDDIDAGPWLESKSKAVPQQPVQEETLHQVDIIPNKPMKGVAPVDASAAPIQVPPDQMPAMMMRALDKYEEMVKQRNAVPAAAPAGL